MYIIIGNKGPEYLVCIFMEGLTTLYRDKGDKRQDSDFKRGPNPVPYHQDQRKH